MSAQIAADTVQQQGAAHDPNRPYKDVATWDLVETLKMQYSEGHPYDDAVVFEVATRAVDAEDPNSFGDSWPPSPTRLIVFSRIRATTSGTATHLREGGTVRTMSAVDGTPEQLIAAIRICQPTAIFLEATAPSHRKAGRALANEFLVLEPVFKEQKAYRDGLPSRKVVGIGRRNRQCAMAGGVANASSGLGGPLATISAGGRGPRITGAEPAVWVRE